MSSESDLSDYESVEVEVEEEVEVEVEEIVEEEITPIVREIETEYQGWSYSTESNGYIFRGVDALVDIINHHNGNVDVFILHNSSIKNDAFLAARRGRIKNLSLYAPVRAFPVILNKLIKDFLTKLVKK